MPSKSAAQAKLMAIAAHKPGGFAGVPQSVGREFHTADKSRGQYKHAGAKAAGVDHRRNDFGGRRHRKTLGY